jgi:hypothetical protein
MTAQPAQIDLADLGPGIAWAFEFDENGRGVFSKAIPLLISPTGGDSFGCT